MTELSLEEIRAQLQASVPNCVTQTVTNGSPSAQHSLLIDRSHGLAAALWLRDELGYDYCSNATAVDWPDRQLAEKVKTRQTVDGVEKEAEESRKTTIPGYLEMVYHLFSMTKNSEPMVMRMRTAKRTQDVTLPSLTPVWRSVEFQEREAFDLFGIVFAGHPDLRRILMWDGFTDHPMRKDYVPPPDDDGELLRAP